MYQMEVVVFLMEARGRCVLMEAVVFLKEAGTYLMVVVVCTLKGYCTNIGKYCPELEYQRTRTRGTIFTNITAITFII